MAEARRRRWRLLGGLAFSGLLLLLGAEAALWIASLLAPDRSGSWRPGSEVRILCVGDSHTFGAGVPESESYPAHLQSLLDARAPGRYSLINLGTPGLSTTQVLARLPLQLARYGPDLVILWAGVNNVWNVADPVESRGGIRARLEVLALRSRLYRLVRVAIHDHSLQRTAARTLADGRRQAIRTENCEGDDCEFMARHEILHGGVVDVVTNRAARTLHLDDLADRTAADIRSIHRLLAGAGVGLVLVRYPLDVGYFGGANAGIVRAGEALGIPVADGSRAFRRLPPGSVEWLHGAHPPGAVYAEIAAELLPLVESLAGTP